MADKNEKFMEQAIMLAKENVNKLNGGPFGAIIVKNGKIIGKGVNSVTMNNDPTAHAEVMAIRDACKNLETYQLEDCEVYSSCEPCPMCMGAIYWARTKKLYYAATKEDAANAGFDDSYIYNEINSPLNKRDLPSEQICREKAVEVFKHWQENSEKIPY